MIGTVHCGSGCSARHTHGGNKLESKRRQQQQQQLGKKEVRGKIKSEISIIDCWRTSLQVWALVRQAPTPESAIDARHRNCRNHEQKSVQHTHHFRQFFFILLGFKINSKLLPLLLLSRVCPVTAVFNLIDCWRTCAIIDSAESKWFSLPHLANSALEICWQTYNRYSQSVSSFLPPPLCQSEAINQSDRKAAAASVWSCDFFSQSVSLKENEHAMKWEKEEEAANFN